MTTHLKATERHLPHNYTVLTATLNQVNVFHLN